MKVKSYVITGFLHGCNVNEQQSKLFIESLLRRRLFVPYPRIFYKKINLLEVNAYL